MSRKTVTGIDAAIGEWSGMTVHDDPKEEASIYCGKRVVGSFDHATVPASAASIFADSLAKKTDKEMLGPVGQWLYGKGLQGDSCNDMAFAPTPPPDNTFTLEQLDKMVDAMKDSPSPVMVPDENGFYSWHYHPSMVYDLQNGEWENEMRVNGYSLFLYVIVQVPTDAAEADGAKPATVSSLSMILARDEVEAKMCVAQKYPQHKFGDEYELLIWEAGD